jgi:hypothetical protein
VRAWFRDGLLPYLLIWPALLAAVLTVPLMWAVLRTRQALRGA